MSFRSKLQGAKKLWPIGLILVMTGLAVWTASRYLTGRTAEVEERLSDQAAKSVVTVVVPARNLQAGEELDLGSLVTRAIPREYVNADAITQDSVSGFVGKKLTRAVSKGTPLLQSFVASYEFKPFSTSIEAGTRAITLPVDEINSVSGMLTAGDKIDILVMTQMAMTPEAGKGEMQLLPLLEGVTVRATGTTTQRELVAQVEQGAGRPSGSRGGSYNTVTIAVPPRDAQRVVLAQQVGRIIALLRRPDDAALFGERLSTSEVFGIKAAPPVKSLETISYIVGGSFATGSQGMRAVAGQGVSAGAEGDAVKKLMAALGGGQR